LTKVTKRKKEEIRALAEAWHQALVALASKNRKEAVPSTP
jgi:hypothetical protein